MCSVMCGRMNAFSDYKRWNCSGSIQDITSERDRPSDIASFVGPFVWEILYQSGWYKIGN